jgi:hypothetical protein
MSRLFGDKEAGGSIFGLVLRTNYLFTYSRATSYIYASLFTVPRQVGIHLSNVKKPIEWYLNL